MKNQKGLTLVELMIATLIGLFLMASLANLLITTNKSVTLSEALAQNQESGRFAMSFMTGFIRLAGYTDDFTVANPPILINTGSTPCIPQACSANNPTDKGDRLAVTYVADAIQTTTSCAGTIVGGPVNGQQQIANVFWVSNDLATLNELQCRTYDYENDVWIDNAPVSIVANVESFEFQVGISAATTNRSAARYVNIDTIINASELLNNVRSVRIALLTSSQDIDPDKVQSTQRSREYIVLDGPIITTAANDSNLLQIFSNTIELPGMIEKAIFNSE